MTGASLKVIRQDKLTLHYSWSVTRPQTLIFRLNSSHHLALPVEPHNAVFKVSEKKENNRASARTLNSGPVFIPDLALSWSVLVWLLPCKRSKRGIPQVLMFPGIPRLPLHRTDELYYTCRVC